MKNAQKSLYKFYEQAMKLIAQNDSRKLNDLLCLHPKYIKLYDQNNNNLLHFALNIHGSKEIIQILIKHNRDMILEPNIYGFTPMHIASDIYGKVNSVNNNLDELLKAFFYEDFII
jgi:hypothetical protein